MRSQLHQLRMPTKSRRWRMRSKAKIRVCWKGHRKWGTHRQSSGRNQERVRKRWRNFDECLEEGLLQGNHSQRRQIYSDQKWHGVLQVPGSAEGKERQDRILLHPHIQLHSVRHTMHGSTAQLSCTGETVQRCCSWSLLSAVDRDRNRELDANVLETGSGNRE